VLGHPLLSGEPVERLVSVPVVQGGIDESHQLQPCRVPSPT
jgi:hypothetical protein